jgi:hypothetical protein
LICFSAFDLGRRREDESDVRSAGRSELAGRKRRGECKIGGGDETFCLSFFFVAERV